MKCINAEWELRNLGVKTIELSIDKEDAELSADELLNIIENYRQLYDAKYVVIKSDVKYPVISKYLQRANFFLIENQVGLRCSRKDALDALNKYRQICEGVSYRSASEDDIQLIFSEIENGIFTTDRVALDSYFGKEIANRRYLLWTKDEISRGSFIHLALYENKPFAFFLDKAVNEKTLHGLLGGLFNSAKLKNLGMMYMYSATLSFIDNGWKFSITDASSNNPQILKLQFMFGKQITTIKNVFVKHFD